MILNIVSVYLFLATIICVYFISYVQSKSDVSYTRVLSLLSLAVAFYLYGYTMEINATTYEQAIFWNNFQYIGIPFIAALWLTTTLMYTKFFYPLKKHIIALIFLIPMISFIARVTNEYHHLYLVSLRVEIINDRLLLVKEIGPLMYLQMVYSFLILVVSLILFVVAFKRDHGGEFAKSFLMITSALFAVIGLGFNILTPFNMHIDVMVLLLPFTGIIVVIAILKYDLLEVSIMARDMAFENSIDGFIIINNNNRLLDFNTEACHIFQSLGIALSEKRLEDIFSHQQDVLVNLLMTENSVFTIEINNEKNIYEVTTKDIKAKNNSIRGYVKTIRNITKMYQANESLKLQASTDELSGLLNRREFIKIANKLFNEQRHQNMYLLMMDLDKFKNVNDKYGHIAGDEVIQTFGELLNKSFRTKDIKARLGGEEFAVIMNDITFEDALEKAESFRKTLSNFKYNINNNEFSITISIGMARAKDQVTSIDQLLNQADQAMYKSKENGRNQVTVG